MGRIDDVINVSGQWIVTAEVESTLVAHDWVVEATPALPKIRPGKIMRRIFAQDRRRQCCSDTDAQPKSRLRPSALARSEPPILARIGPPLMRPPVLSLLAKGHAPQEEMQRVPEDVSARSPRR